MGWRDQKLKSSGNILTTKCMNVHMYVLCKANATMYMYVYVLHTCMYCVHVCTLVVHIYSHTCTQVVRTVVHIIVKWHFHFTNTDGVSMMSNYIFNTYSSKRDVLHVSNWIPANLFYFFLFSNMLYSHILVHACCIGNPGFFLHFWGGFWTFLIQKKQLNCSGTYIDKTDATKPAIALQFIHHLTNFCDDACTMSLWLR